MLAKNQVDAFGAFYDSARNNKTLDPKTTYLIHMGAAMAMACYPCMEYYFAPDRSPHPHGHGMG